MQTQEAVLRCHKQPLFWAAKKKYKRAGILPVKSLAYATKSSPWPTKLGLILATD